MKANTTKTLFLLLLLASLIPSTVSAQEYRSATQPAESGKAPGMKVRLLSSAGEVKTYAIIFSKGDDVVSGLTDFARQYNIKSAHYQGIGDAMSMEVGWFDYNKKQFKVIPIDTVEVTSFTGDIAWLKGKPVAHTHASGSLSDGSVKGGHLLKLIVGPTFEVMLTAEPTPLYKKLNEEFQAGVIDPELKQ